MTLHVLHEELFIQPASQGRSFSEDPRTRSATVALLSKKLKEFSCLIQLEQHEEEKTTPKKTQTK